jgi:hypothetical protein
MTDYKLIQRALADRREWYAGENADIAKRLVNNGVIILPRKLGGVVYYVNGNKNLYITEHEVFGFRIDKKGLRLDLDDFQPYYPNERLFFSREAAIKELNRRLLNNEN